MSASGVDIVEEMSWRTRDKPSVIVAGPAAIRDSYEAGVSDGAVESSDESDSVGELVEVGTKPTGG